MELQLSRKASGESTPHFVKFPTAHAMSTGVTQFCHLPGPCRHLKLPLLIKFKDFLGLGNQGSKVSLPKISSWQNQYWNLGIRVYE